MTNSDIMQPLGFVTNHEGEPQKVLRDYDGLDLCAVTVLLPAGVAELEQRIAQYWNALAAYRLRTADLSGIDMAEAREWLAGLPNAGDPNDLESVDWVDLGRRLKAMEPFGGYGELRKLHALLTGTETPKEG